MRFSNVRYPETWPSALGRVLPIAADRCRSLPIAADRCRSLPIAADRCRSLPSGVAGRVCDLHTAVVVKVYSMPAIGRRNVHASARVGRRRINPMEETAECSDALGASRLWRLIGQGVQRCGMRRGQAGCRMGAEAVMRRCSRASAMMKRAGEVLCEAPGANVRSWAALSQGRRSVQISRNRCAHV
ncbi:hypothetical protein OKW39_008570 [Paraburkholderia sp. MM6662-R1]